LRSVEVRRAERAWFTRNRNGLGAAWVALVLLNVVAIAAWPSLATVPFHLIATGFRTGPDANGTRGTGLGLALVRTVAEAHGGSARVRSVPGEGSEFEITLPAG